MKVLFLGLIILSGPLLASGSNRHQPRPQHRANQTTQSDRRAGQRGKVEAVPVSEAESKALEKVVGQLLDQINQINSGRASVSTTN